MDFGLRALVFVRDSSLDDEIQIESDIKDQRPKAKDHLENYAIC
jgi:hypothetical protein